MSRRCGIAAQGFSSTVPALRAHDSRALLALEAAMATVFLPPTDPGGAPGAETLRGSDGPETLRGGDGPDFVIALGGDDAVRGRAGKDTLDGGRGSDLLVGAAGDDRLFGDYNPFPPPPVSELPGEGDTLLGGGGNDLALGQAGDDLMRGQAGDDTLVGGTGYDLLLGGLGDDFLLGGAGYDRLLGGGGDDELRGGGPGVVGSSPDADDELRGGAGQDSLFGEGGSDWLFGDAGADRLEGGADADLMTGGAGADRFVWGDAGASPLTIALDTGLGEDGRDILEDFTPGQDILDFSPIAALAGPFAFIGEADFSGTGNEIRAERIGADLVLEIDWAPPGGTPDAEKDGEILLRGVAALGPDDLVL
jgi:Ca2+-binding RTX toxin-like protein